MLSTVSSLELHYLASEFQVLVSAKVDKIWQLEKKEIDIRLHLPGVGRKILRISLPSLIYISDQKQEYPDSPHGFTMFLRKRIGSARVREIAQHGSERILKILFETKETKYWMVVELFGKGNVILCDPDMNIISPLEQQVWQDRVVKSKERYVFPTRGHDLFTLEKEEFMAILDPKKSVVKSLATDFGLGGTYAEEICKVSGVEKSSVDPSEEELRRIFDSFWNLVHAPSHPVTLSRGGEVFDILPFQLSGDKDIDIMKSASFNEALDSYHSTFRNTANAAEKEVKERGRLTKVEKIIDMQSRQVRSHEKKIAEDSKKAELIYLHLNDIKKLYDIIGKMKETMSWEEIRKELKSHSSIIDMDLSKKTITLDLKE